MKTNHFTLTHCVITIVAAVGLLIAFGIQIGTLFLLAAVLLCPLMMVFMMRSMMGGDAHYDLRNANHHRNGDGGSAPRAERDR